MGSRKPSRELSIEETLTWTVEIYLSNFVAFFIPVLISSLISGVLSAAIADYVKKSYLYYGTPPAYFSVGEMLGSFLAVFGLLLLSVVVAWVISAIANGICVKYASNLINVGKASLEEAFNVTVSKLISLLISAFIVAILVVVGLIVLIIPGVIMAIMFVLVVPAIMNENIGALDGMSRSRSLVSHRWMKTFFLFLVIIIAIAIVSSIGSLIVAPLTLSFGWLVSSIITAFVEPIIPISMTVYYYSMLAKEEQQNLQPPPPPPF